MKQQQNGFSQYLPFSKMHAFQTASPLSHFTIFSYTFSSFYWSSPIVHSDTCLLRHNRTSAKTLAIKEMCAEQVRRTGGKEGDRWGRAHAFTENALPLSQARIHTQEERNNYNKK